MNSSAPMTENGLAYAAWCAAHNCQHAHCPYGCDHPQPFEHEGKLYCGKHWFDDLELVEMVPCDETIC